MRVLSLLALTFLVSCQSMVYTGEQCSPFIVFRNPDEVDVANSKCFCRQYTFSENYVGPEQGTEKDMPLSYCNRVVGFKKYTDVATFWEKVRRAIAEEN